MKKIKKVILLIIVLVSMDVFYSCANSRWGTDAGLNVTWGPNGPRVRPHVDFDIYSGGRLGR
jgi:hypothetical protein